MKYSTATILVIAQGIFAAPSFLNKIGHKNSKASHRSTGGDITLSIKVSQSTMKDVMHKAVNEDICWLLCASEEIPCPADWNMKHSTATILVLAQGIIAAPSILSKLSSENVKAIHISAGGDYTLSIKLSQSPMESDLRQTVNFEACWLACFGKERECPKGWGNCWTCCKSTD
ncbi:hypothetical protein FCULG_00006082 [Fusarium culmorum]|uniref:Uncharacterized protein n=1 Tax=Fusarium culmorum TaxID=5516 RepID=A0A2T4GV18_FUSCU|nr:hypothetical protein FCULG_00006082 [Fusarium culmorum]